MNRWGLGVLWLVAALPVAASVNPALSPDVPSMAREQGRSVLLSEQVIDLSLSDAVYLGLRNNRGIRSAYLQRIAQKFDLRVAADAFNPKLVVRGDYRANRATEDRTRTSNVSPTATLLGEYGTRFSLAWVKQFRTADEAGRYRSDGLDLTVVQPLLRDAGWDVTTAPLRLARLSEDANRLQLKASVSQTISQVIGAYRELLRAQEQARISREALARTQELLEVNRAMIRAGRMAEFEIVQTEADVASQELNVEESANQVDSARLALQPLLAPLVEKYNNNPGVCAYLQAMQLNLLKTVVDQLVDDSRTDAQRKQGLIEQYAPNQAIVHHATSGAPVVFESHPTYDNLFGRIEYSSDQGALYTSYRQLRPGALHRANGGFLILEAEKMLGEPFVWDALKRALQSRQLKMESPLAELGRLAAVSLTPQVIPLQLKVIIIGSRQIYYTLQDLDPDFQEMFRVLVDFDEDIPLGEDSLEQFAQLLKTRTSEEGMAPLSGAAVARLATYSARLAEHQGRLSARIGDLFQLVSEADFIRQLANEEVIQLGHIERALKAKQTRTGRVSARILDDMLAGIILIDTAGAAVGKCNGLTVLEVGDSVFGVPARISATVYPGSSGIVDIEREVNLGQPIHSKGVMILTGYLGSRYAQEFPLEISASIALEQSYGYVDGDSASLGEVCTLISALSRTPLKQCFAITGSINQFGEVQAVGGVNEKIEGFFRLCEARGLTGEQGVIIPRANVTTLMLDERVLQAVRAGQFHVYAVREVDEALALLVGKPVGAQDEKGRFPKGSVNDLVVARLQEISELGMEEDDKEKDKPAEKETVAAKDKAAAKKD